VLTIALRLGTACSPLVVPDVALPAADEASPADTGAETDTGPGLDSADTVDTGWGGLPGSDEEPRPGLDLPPILDDTVLHTVAITLGAASRQVLLDDPYSWTDGAVEIDGEHVADVGIRLRGKLGSFRTLDQKPKFKIDFNQYADVKFQGLEAISLNNEVVDCSYLKEPTGYAVYAMVGVPAPRASYARVTVDGEDYGLYVVVEVPDDNFLRDRFVDPTGNFYDGKYLWYGGRNYDMVDFKRRLDDNFQLEEGTDVGLADIFAVTEAVESDGGSLAERLDPLFDLDSLHRNVVVEQWIGHLDGYSLNQNNYRVYFNPWDGRAEIVPWDLDYAFFYDYQWGFDWDQPRGAIVKGCWRDDDCVAVHQGYVADAVAAIDTADLVRRVDAWSALIAEAAEADPRRECSAGEVAEEQRRIRAWAEDGSRQLADAWDVE
jgi:hypothetical protein